VSNSNPIVRTILGPLNMTQGQIAVIQQAMDGLVRERAAGSSIAILINPINIGIGSK
jgi:hypothetical protein